MSRERFSTLLRLAGLLLGGAVLAVVLSARGAAGLPPRRAAEPIFISRASGLSAASPYIPQTLHDLALGGGSGPYTSTVRAYSFDGDVRPLANVPPIMKPQLPEVDAGESQPARPVTLDDPVVQPAASGPAAGPNVPSPLSSFAGLDHAHAANVYPPDTNGDVGPIYYIQTVNDNVGIYTKTTGSQAATFSFDALFGAAPTGTPCDANNHGDPVALYDAQADRFIISDFAFANVHASPYYECIAVSKTSDPVNGGWWLFPMRADDNAHQFLADYPKLGVWPDGIYMSANMFDCSGACTGADFKGVRVWALNRAALVSGSTLTPVFFDTTSAYFGLLPANLRGPLPPAGTPNFFVSNDQSIFALDVFKFHVDFTNTLSSTFTLTPTQVAIAPYNLPPATVPEQTGNGLDSLGTRLMMQNQYRNIGGAESLWVAHTVDNAPTGVRWYQLDVSGGTIAAAPVQQSTYKPDASHRWLPSLAVDKFGDMLVGYSVSSASSHPAIRYSGRLSSDPASSLGQGENTLISGGGGQTILCGGVACIRWGDYSGMTVDPVDDCTFWYTTEYYSADGGNWETRIGSIRFPVCGLTLDKFIYLPAMLDGHAATWTNIVQEGFEGAWPGAGWTVSDFGPNTYFWGKRNCRANAGTFSLWAMGGGSSGSGLSCGANYIDNANAWAIYGPFSLAGATAAQFNLQLWLNSPSGQDSACISASVDNNNFVGKCFTGSSSNVFVPESLDLSAVAGLGDLRGQTNVWVAVVFQSNPNVNLPEGAYVDDLLLRKCTFALCPASLSAPSAESGQLQSQAVHLVRPTK